VPIKVEIQALNDCSTQKVVKKQTMIVPAADAALAVAYSPALNENDFIKLRTTPFFQQIQGPD
jgi:hypothetical protein